MAINWENAVWFDSWWTHEMNLDSVNYKDFIQTVPVPIVHDTVEQPPGKLEVPTLQRVSS